MIYYDVSRVIWALRQNGVGKIRVSGYKIISQCPFHEDRHPSLSIDVGKGVYHCFGCEAKGTLRGLLGRLGCGIGIEGVGQMMYWDERPSVVVKDSELDEEGKKYVGECVGKVPKYVLEKRGISKETCKKFALGFDGVKKAVVFPIRNKNGLLCGYALRYIRRLGYWFNSGFKKTLLYGEYEVGLENGRCKKVVLVEGFFDVLRLIDSGVWALGILGTNMTREQRLKLYGLVRQKGIDEVCVMLDGDDAGRLATQKIIKDLSDFRIKITPIYLDKKKDPADLKEEEIKSILEIKEGV